MPKRNDIKKIMVLGSGPIIIGQAAEFDYSGTQACQALKEEGFEVVLINSNPATIMTDPDMAETVYIEPLNPETVSEILRRERPDGLLATLGGQTGLNLAEQLHEAGVLKEVGVKLLGTPIEAIKDGEDRERFRDLMARAGEPIPASAAVNDVDAALSFAAAAGYPLIIRPAYTLGGTGGGIATNEEELIRYTRYGLGQSIIGQVLVEEAVLGLDGWGEFELEVMRDRNDNCVIICPMENFDPMGYHTGESIVVAPTQTLNDRDFQTLRRSAIKLIRALGVEGGCNIQFALNHYTGDYKVIEVNPRVSRSSALASKATGYPIARIAAKIAVGLTLDEIDNSVTWETKACFEPTIDYVVVKIPRWPFDKLRTANTTIGTQMKSTGEAMAIGRTFEEAFQKAIRSLEIKRGGYGFDGSGGAIKDMETLRHLLRNATHERMFHILDALRKGMAVEEIYSLSGINPWFLHKLKGLYEFGRSIEMTPQSVRRAKRKGFSDHQIATVCGTIEGEVRKFRIGEGIVPTYKVVDTCAAEFAARTPYLYSTYETEDESSPSDRKKVLVVGSGPIRIGQGIEFDYCCVHSAMALRDEKIEAIMVNNNPETVSTDSDISDKLYFEPLTFESVMNIVDREKPDGVILQFGGQTSINLAIPLYKAGVTVLGTHPLVIDMIEEREKFASILTSLGINQAPHGTTRDRDEALEIAEKIGFPLLVRPSYVLGGRAMRVIWTVDELKEFVDEALAENPEHPILIDRFLENAVEVDVDAVSDGEEVFVGAIMEHVEAAGIHSGDSACVIPPLNLTRETRERIIEQTARIAREVKIVGLINIQYAVASGEIYVLEANPRASRTIPYVSKAIGVPLAKLATRVMLGHKLKELGTFGYCEPLYVAVKETVFPFLKLEGVDPILSPEMKSTGEVMSIDRDFGRAFYKAQMAVGTPLPLRGNILLNYVGMDGVERFAKLASELEALRFNLYAADPTHRILQAGNVRSAGIPPDSYEESLMKLMSKRDLDMVVYITDSGRVENAGYRIRRWTIEQNIPFITTLEGLEASIAAIRSAQNERLLIRSIQEHYGKVGLRMSAPTE